MSTLPLMLPGLARSSSCLDFFPGAVCFLGFFFAWFFCGYCFLLGGRRGEEIENVIFLQMDEVEMYHPGSSKISGPAGDDFELCWLFTSEVP